MLAVEVAERLLICEEEMLKLIDGFSVIAVAAPAAATIKSMKQDIQVSGTSSQGSSIRIIQV